MNGRGVMLIVVLCCAAGAGCSDKNHVPKGILSRDKMEQVMWDMAQADQYASLYLTKDSARIDRKKETMRLYAEVFRLHQVSPEEFRKSYRYYLDHPELDQLLFDSVIARGVRARSEMYDRPGQYHPPTAPAVIGKPGAIPGPVRPGVVRPGATGPAVVPGVKPGGSRPGMQPAGAEAEMMRRMHEASSRKQDSIMRSGRLKWDTVRKRP